MIAKSLKNNVMNLNEIDKIRLMELISDSLENPSVEIEQKWAKESERRYRLYKQGKTKAVSFLKITRKYMK